MNTLKSKIETHVRTRIMCVSKGIELPKNKKKNYIRKWLNENIRRAYKKYYWCYKQEHHRAPNKTTFFNQLNIYTGPETYLWQRIKSS